MHRLLPLLIALTLGACSATGGGRLAVESDRIVALAAPAYDVQAPEGWRLAGPAELGPDGDGSVSLAGALGSDAFVLVRVAGTGDAAARPTSPVFELPCGRFPTRTFCAVASSADRVTEDGIAFLEANGFPATPALWVRQLFVPIDEDGLETVFTYGERVGACLTPVAEVQAAFDDRLLDRLVVTELGVACAAPEGY